MVEEVSGTSFEDFFRRYVSGLDEIPYDQFLTHAGLALKTESRKSADPGFFVGRSPEGPAVVSATPGSAAQVAGLRVNDPLVELNGAPISGRISAWMRERTPGEIHQSESAPRCRSANCPLRSGRAKKTTARWSMWRIRRKSSCVSVRAFCVEPRSKVRDRALNSSLDPKRSSRSQLQHGK